VRRSRTGGLWAGLVLSALVLLLLLVFILQNGGPVQNWTYARGRETAAVLRRFVERYDGVTRYEGSALDEAVNCYAHNAARSTPAPTATALETRSRTPPI